MAKLPKPPKWLANTVYYVQYTLIIPLIFLALILAVILIVPRFLIGLLTKCFRRDLQGFVEDLNVLFTFNKTVDFPLNTMGIVVLNGKVEAAMMQQNFQSRVFSLRDQNGELLYGGLRTYWVQFLGYPFWKQDPDFDIRNHLREFDYKGPLALPSAPSEQDLHCAIGGIISAPWPKNKSPWELLFVHNYKGLNQSVVLFRIDHVLADGLSIFELFKVLTQSEWRLPKIKASERKLTTFQNLAMLFKVPCDSLHNAFELFGTRRLPFQKSGRSSEVIFSASPEITVDVIKNIKNHFKVSYAAVVYAAVCAAVARSMEKSGRSVPKKLNCTIIYPRPNHPGGLSIHALAAYIFKYNASDARVVTGMGVIGCDVFVLRGLLLARWTLRSSTPEKRLLRLHKSLTRLNRSAASVGIGSLGQALKIFPIPLLTFAIKAGKVFSTTNVGITSMPVTTSPDFYEGVEIIELTTANSLIMDTALMISLGGMNNRQRVSFCVNKKLFESEEIARNIGKCFAEEIQSLVSRIV